MKNYVKLKKVKAESKLQYIYIYIYSMSKELRNPFFYYITFYYFADIIAHKTVESKLQLV